MPNTNTKLVDSKTIAALFELTPRRIQQLTKEGVIAATKEGNANRYDLLPTIQKYIRYLTAKANGREPSKKDAEIEGRRLEAEADLKRSKADIAALQLKELEGTMHLSLIHICAGVTQASAVCQSQHSPGKRPFRLEK